VISLTSIYRLPKSKPNNTTTNQLTANIHNPARDNINTNRVQSVVEDPSELTIVVPANLPSQSSSNHPLDSRVDEISALKEAMANQKVQMEMQTNRVNLQITQFKQILTQLTTRKDQSSLNDIVLLPDELPGNNNQPAGALTHHLPNEMTELSASNESSSSFETRLSNLEMFQYRINNFYIESDLFKDTSYKS
jgi:hypothetical protein